MMPSPVRTTTAACLLLALGCTAGCAPAPKWDAQAEAVPFLKAMTFADQKSIRLLRFKRWEDGGSTLIFTTDKVDFGDPFVTNLFRELFPSKDMVGVIETISDYRFTKPAAKYSEISGELPGNKHARIDILRDGDHYVCEVYVVQPKPQEPPGVSRTTPATPGTSGTKK